MGYGPEEDAAWVLEPGSDFLGQAQLIHLVNEEKGDSERFCDLSKI